MMMKFFNPATLTAICFGLSACAPAPQSLRPSPLQPAPVAPVSSSSLPPASIPNAPGGYTPPGIAATGGNDLQAIPQLPAAANTGVSLSDNVSVSPDIDFNRNAVLGAWNVSARADTCALNLSLTTWTGGFRASTRKCSDELLLKIGAWTLDGKQLTLLNAQGETLARLVTSGPNRFDGTTEAGGSAISVFR